MTLIGYTMRGEQADPKELVRDVALTEETGEPMVDRTTERANGVTTDLRYATPLSATVEVRAGGYDALTDAALVIITAGVNERPDATVPTGHRSRGHRTRGHWTSHRTLDTGCC